MWLNLNNAETPRGGLQRDKYVDWQLGSQTVRKQFVKELSNKLNLQHPDSIFLYGECLHCLLLHCLITSGWKSAVKLDVHSHQVPALKVPQHSTSTSVHKAGAHIAACGSEGAAISICVFMGMLGFPPFGCQQEPALESIWALSQCCPVPPANGDELMLLPKSKSTRSIAKIIYLHILQCLQFLERKP